MQGLPFEVPRSLSSYITQYGSDPDKGITNLEAHLKKRGMDAVGYFLLSWLYYSNNNQEKAIEYSLKAKCCAPGSPFFEHLHYFLVHPAKFSAWKPFDSELDDNTREIPSGQYGYTLDLDTLIEQLSKAESKKIKISPEAEKDNRNLAKKAEMVGDIASETLAKIYEKQNRYDEAIQTLEKLKQIKPGKSSYYDGEMKRLRVAMSESEA